MDAKTMDSRASKSASPLGMELALTLQSPNASRHHARGLGALPVAMLALHLRCTQQSNNDPLVMTANRAATEGEATF